MSANAKVTIPRTWSDVTLRQFQGYLEAVQSPSEITAIAKACGALTSLSEQDVLKMPYSEALRLAGEVLPVVSGDPPTDLVTFIDIDGVEYGFHPHLMAMTLGEFVDLTSLDPRWWPTAHQALAILYRPVTRKRGERYDIAPYAADLSHADKFLDLPMTVAGGAGAFFLRLRAELPTTLLDYSVHLMAEAAAELTVGTRSSRTWRRVTLRALMQSRPWRQQLSFSSLNGSASKR